uniref:Uncharacterized protein n=1 Tax=Klebsiella pneumoniae TaxID=573 RepID=A0A8B0SQA4_KLEPN|nr:hypothetical protein [Klebsiella pneumoniae]
MNINYGAFCFLPHNTATNHLHVMRQKKPQAPRRLYRAGAISYRYIHALCCLAL